MHSNFDYKTTPILLLIAILLIYSTLRKIPVVNFFSKFMFIIVYGSLVGIVLMPMFALRPRNVKNFKILSKFYKYMANLVGLKYKIENIERLESLKGAVIVSNHQSNIDCIETCSSLKANVSVLAKIQLLLTGPYGITSYLAGAIGINRSKSKQAIEVLNEALKRAKENNTLVWTFPEGTRRNTGQIHEFKKGVFLAAIHAQMPIVPLVYSCYKPFLDPNSKTFNSGEITMSVMDEISTEGLIVDNVDELIAKTHQIMSLKFKETVKEK